LQKAAAFLPTRVDLIISGLSMFFGKNTLLAS
jgi:hypothetical protein